MPIIDRSSKPKRTIKRNINGATAGDVIGPITTGMEVYALCKGQFSIIELITHVLDTVGPAHMTIATWTASGADLSHVHALLTDGRVLSARWLVDFSFPSRQPSYCQQLRERFGDSCIRATACHAKFCLIKNDEWDIVIRTSANLNLNRRLESFEISDDRDLGDWLMEVVDAAFAGDAADIATAVKAPAKTQATVQYLFGQVENKPPVPMEFAANGRGISYD